MKKILFIFLIGLSCLTSLAAERVAPTLPDATTLKSGNTYYLYNVGTGEFLDREGSYPRVGETGQKVTLTANENGTYTIEFADSYYLLESSGSLFIANMSSDWTFTDIGNGIYTIQDGSSGPSNYLGFKADEKNVFYNCTTSDNVKWKLIDGDIGDMYCARLKLYNLIQTMSKYSIDNYKAVYDNVLSTVSQINENYTRLNRIYTLTLDYIVPVWNDYPILFESSTDNGWYYNGYFHQMECGLANNVSTLTATVFVDEDATFCYRIYGLMDQIDVYVDGKKTRSFDCAIMNTNNRNERYFEELTPGTHTIQWKAMAGSSRRQTVLSEIGVKKTPLISVNLLEEGSLGTEVLYNVDKIQKVRRLKIKGKMNDIDWNTLSLMKDSLFSLDLGETDITSIKDECFEYYRCLHFVKLPENLTSIGEMAFFESGLDSINIPFSLKNIGYGAFQETTINSAMLPDNCMNVGASVFRDNPFLVYSRLPKSLKTIPDGIYNDCVSLKTFVLPDSITRIGDDAFLGAYQFGKGQKLDIPSTVTYIGSNAFNGTGFTSAELPVSLFRIDTWNYLPNTIMSLRLNSPTVMEHTIPWYNTIYEHTIIQDGNCRANITLIVPSYLVNAYKLDSYWYNFGNIEGFDTKEISNWVINKDLVLGARDRFNGTPSIEIAENIIFKINGTDGMDIKDFSFTSNPSGGLYSRIMINPNYVNVNGNLWSNFHARDDRWYFVSLPFDMKVGDITGYDNTSKYAIRYYDGLNRAINGATGSWKNLTANDTIPAGSGFIFQVNKESMWKFPSMNNASKQYLTSNKVFVKALAANHSDDAANSGWNLVGNPYQCWYNLHKLNFTAPITVYENYTYAAYSVIDDDYAIAPNQAFFVQCPDGINEISFPLDGRQMTSDIVSQSGAKEFGAPGLSTSKRSIIDLSVSNGSNSDRTRVVLNDNASETYETNCDAAKFMSDVANVPQIYSYDAADNKYAINERPEGNGIVKLAFVAPESGCFTLSLTRNSAEKVLLVDNETSQTVDLTGQSYSFTANAGTYNSRFELRVNANNGTTGVESSTVESTSWVKAVVGGVTVTASNGNVEIFTTDGKILSKHTVNGSQSFIALPAGKYIVKANGKSTKVVVL